MGGGSANTVNGGAGNDTIYSNVSTARYQYAPGDGNDIIKGFTSSSSLVILGNTDTFSTTQSGDDVIVNVGSGKITLQGAASLSSVNIIPQFLKGTESNDSLTNNVSEAMILALGGDDTVYNSGSYASIDGGDGNDYIDNSGDNASIDAGAGNDSIYSSGSQVTIDGGRAMITF